MQSGYGVIPDAMSQWETGNHLNQAVQDHTDLPDYRDRSTEYGVIPDAMSQWETGNHLNQAVQDHTDLPDYRDRSTEYGVIDVFFEPPPAATG